MTVGRLLALACVAAACGDARAPGERPEKVLLAVIDAAHAAHLSSYGNAKPTTPVIDALAHDGVRFARAFSNNTWTLASTASLMTGQLQETHGAVTKQHRLPEAARTAAEIFANAGWKTAAFVQMGFASQEFGFGQGFGEFVYYGKTEEAKSSRVVPEATRWLAAHVDDSWFAYVHLRRPHSPYRPSARALAIVEGDCPLADGARDAEFEFADLFEERELPQVELDHVRHLYEANLAMADALLKPIVSAAREQGALVVVTSDHGEALGQHGVFGHGQHLFAEGIDVPLVFWWPGAVARVDDGPACTIDVLPTILALCDIEPPSDAHFDGHSLVERMLGRAAPPRGPVMISARYNHGVVPSSGVVDEHWKLVYRSPQEILLYDRRADPFDLSDRASAHPDVVERLAPIAAQWSAAHADLAERGALLETIDPDVEADLRALGYGE